MRAKPLTFRHARSLRSNTTLPEGILWRHLRGRQLGGLFFRRQHPIGPYILDFYCSAARLALEIDGAVHEQPDQMAHDRYRDYWLRQRGIRILRFAAADILRDEALAGVLAAIAEASAPSASRASALGTSPAGGGGT
jgi:very-short-patch-repair endonuclease